MHDDAIIQQVVALLQAEFGAKLVGVLAGGSRLRGEGDINSDLDLVVVIALPQRRRRNIVLGGVEVEMFLNPPFQMRRYFEQDRTSGRGLMPHLCSTGHVVYDPYGTLAELQAEARAIWEAGPPALNARAIWHIRYATADGLRDIQDVLQADPARAAYLIGWWLPQIVSNYYRIKRRWQIKPKRVLTELETWDMPAATLARRACLGSVTERFAALQALSEHTLAPLGGLMPLAWSSDWEALAADPAAADTGATGT